MENSEHTSFHCYLFLVSFFLLYLYMLKTNFFFQKDYLISIFFAKLSNRCILRIHIKYCKSILNKLNQAGKAKRVSSQLQFNQYYYRNLKKSTLTLYKSVISSLNSNFQNIVCCF